jgi:Ca2+-binding RTX toxin-like protein
MFNQVWKTGGNVETDQRDYLPGTTIVGSYKNDVATGGATNDTLSGLSGNDNLNGGGGDDLVMGGAGMDVLSGGLGSNAVQGGLDADTYIPVIGVTHEQVADIGGVDRLDLSSISIGSATFMRIGDDLFIFAPGIAIDGIGITGQWVDASRIEQFTFSEGTYAATYIETLAGQNSSVCYDAMGQPLICSPYGLPVVLDLDGDGIELIELAKSRVRFDVDGDGKAERIGWVGRDDGILALDRNGNGRIDDFSEISFRSDFLGAGTDLEGLYAYDTDGDGFLTAADDRFGDFLVWRDINSNGHSEKRELFSFAELGIVSISLERRDVTPLDRDGRANQILATSTFETADGRLHRLGDVALFADMEPVRSAGADEYYSGLLAVPFA